MLIAFSGLKGSGKDTAALVLMQEYGFTKIAFADALREMALVIDPIVGGNYEGVLRLSDLVSKVGWDVAKRANPEVRRLLQRIGTEAGREFFHENVWVEILDKTYNDLSWPNSRYVITDCRFDNELTFVHEKNGTVCWISRPGVESDGHASESTAIRDKADYFIDNNEGISDLEEDVRFLMHLKGVRPIVRRITEQTGTLY